MKRLALLAIVFALACSSADSGATDSIKNSDSVVVDSGAGKDSLPDSVATENR